MPTTAQVIFDEEQADGRRRVLYRYTHDSGVTYDHGPFLLAAGTNAQTDANNRIAVIDGQIEQDELTRGLNDFLSGKDLDNESYPVNGINTIRFQALKYALNLMKADNTTEAKAETFKTIKPYITKFTNTQIANLINSETGGSNWNATKVGNVKTKINTFITAFDDLEHGEEGID